MSVVDLKMFALGVLIVFCLGCTDSADAKRTLEAQGYTDVEITGWRPFMAGEDEDYSTGFKAKSVTGQEVTGAVTGGFLKGNTIRTD